MTSVRPLRVQPPQPVRNQQRIPVQQHPTASRARSGSALNPTAMPFRPVDASIASQPAILREPPPPPAYRYPETGVRPHLVYTEINHVRAPTMHPARVVIPRLRELPDDYIQEDGSVELHLQWVIAQAGYAHFEAGGNGRAQLVQDSWIRFDGRVYGLSGEIIRWLAGEIPGGILRVSVQDAARFWGPHLAARGRESESSLK